MTRLRVGNTLYLPFCLGIITIISDILIELAFSSVTFRVLVVHT